MNKAKTLRSICGITQQQFAPVLNISRAQLSSYENGTEILPVAAECLLDLMLYQIVCPYAWTNRPPKTLQLAEKQIEVEKLLRDIAPQEKLLKDKIRVAESECEAQCRTLNAVRYLTNREEITWAEILKIVLKNQSKTSDQQKLYGYKLKFEMLKNEKELLKSKLHQIRSLAGFD